MKKMMIGLVVLAVMLMGCTDPTAVGEEETFLLSPPSWLTGSWDSPGIDVTFTSNDIIKDRLSFRKAFSDDIFTVIEGETSTTYSILVETGGSTIHNFSFTKNTDILTDYVNGAFDAELVRPTFTLSFEFLEDESLARRTMDLPASMIIWKDKVIELPLIPGFSFAGWSLSPHRWEGTWELIDTQYYTVPGNSDITLYAYFIK